MEKYYPVPTPDAWKDPLWENPYFDWKVVEYARTINNKCVADIVMLYKFGVCTIKVSNSGSVIRILNDNQVEYSTKTFSTKPRIIWLKSAGENIDKFFSKRVRG